MVLYEYTAATAEPVTLTELKMQMRMSTVSGHPEDDLMNAYIKTARMEAETKLNRTIMPTVFDYFLDDFPSDTEALYLPCSPISSSDGDMTVTFYEDASCQSTTLPATAYDIVYQADPPYIIPSYNSSHENEWPDNVMDKANAVKVTFKAGWALNASSECSTKIEGIKTWIRIRAADLYEHRESKVEGRIIADLNRNFFDGLLDPYKAEEVH